MFGHLPSPLIGALILGVCCAPGCHLLSPVPIQGNQNIADELVVANDEPIEFGRPIKWLDTAGWVFGIPGKVLLYDRRIDNHKITEPTIDSTVEYLEANNLAHVKVRVNQYAPFDDFKRLHQNKTVGWAYRYSLGLVSVGSEMLLPGRLFGGDHFNPYTQTVHLYSDVPAIALHELAHSKDFSRRDFPGTYGFAYLWFPLWHETIASRDVMAHLYDRHDRNGIIEANRLLYPAYGTYVGNWLGWWAPGNVVPIYYGSVLAGHFNGRILSQDVDLHLAEYDSMFRSTH